MAARDLERLGPGVTGISFTVHDVASTAEWICGFDIPVAEVTEAEIILDVDRTWGCEYRFTEHVLTSNTHVTALISLFHLPKAA